MTDDGIVKVRLSGTDTGRLADAIAGLDGWTVLSRTPPHPNRREPGAHVHMAVRYGLPAIERIKAYLAATGWAEHPGGTAGAVWNKGGHNVGVPHEDGSFGKQGALRRIAAVEGRPLHELLTAIETGKG